MSKQLYKFLKSLQKHAVIVTVFFNIYITSMSHGLLTAPTLFQKFIDKATIVWVSWVGCWFSWRIQFKFYLYSSISYNSISKCLTLKKIHTINRHTKAFTTENYQVQVRIYSSPLCCLEMFEMLYISEWALTGLALPFSTPRCGAWLDGQSDSRHLSLKTECCCRNVKARPMKAIRSACKVLYSVTQSNSL